MPLFSYIDAEKITFFSQKIRQFFRKMQKCQRSFFLRMSDAFSALVSAFLEENARLNLSAIREEKGVREKHIFDSLAVSEFLENAQKILDLGTGGGFPTLPLALSFPEKQFFPLDATAKKILAVQRIAKKIGISSLFPLIGRAEELAHDPKLRGKFDAVVSRAAAPFAVVIELSAGFLNAGGIFCGFRGPDCAPHDETIGEAVGLFFREKKEYALPSGESRAIWIFEKRGKCPSAFPRKWA